MQIIIVGDGKVGVALTEQLSSEGHDITVIDSNPKVLEQSLESYDVMVVHGNGASIGVLKEAGVATKVLSMLPYKDPDEFIKNCGQEAFQKRLDGAENTFFFEIFKLFIFG